jgi:hypothetical protein
MAYSNRRWWKKDGRASVWSNLSRELVSHDPFRGALQEFNEYHDVRSRLRAKWFAAGALAVGFAGLLLAMDNPERSPVPPEYSSESEARIQEVLRDNQTLTALGVCAVELSTQATLDRKNLRRSVTAREQLQPYDWRPAAYEAAAARASQADIPCEASTNFASVRQTYASEIVTFDVGNSGKWCADKVILARDIDEWAGADERPPIIDFYQEQYTLGRRLATEYTLTCSDSARSVANVD